MPPAIIIIIIIIGFNYGASHRDPASDGDKSLHYEDFCGILSLFTALFCLSTT